MPQIAPNMGVWIHVYTYTYLCFYYIHVQIYVYYMYTQTYILYTRYNVLYIHIHICILKWSEIAQSCPTLCDPMDCSLPVSSVHGIFQAIVLAWIAISFSRGSSQPRDGTRISRIVDKCFTVWATREVHSKNTVCCIQRMFL